MRTPDGQPAGWTDIQGDANNPRPPLRRAGDKN